MVVIKKQRSSLFMLNSGVTYRFQIRGIKWRRIQFSEHRFAIENALRGVSHDTSDFPSSFLEDGEDSARDDTAPQMTSLNRDQNLGNTQRKEQQIADAAMAKLEHLSDNFAEKQDRSLAQLGKEVSSDEGLRNLAARAEAARKAAAEEQTKIAKMLLNSSPKMINR